MPLWRGTPAEFAELTQAVEHNCTCAKPSMIAPYPPKCAACRMLNDQDALNHLEFGRIAARRSKEFDEGPEGGQDAV